MGGYWISEIAKCGKIFENNDIDIENYIDEFYRILKDDAHCYIMTNNFNICHFLDVISKSKFHFVKCVIWDKQRKICSRYYMCQYEYIIFIRKGKDKAINNCGCSDILSVPIKKMKGEDGRNIHDTEKPVDLMKTLILNSSEKGEIVLDPFMGIASAGVAALQVDRSFIGFEIDKKYFDFAENRLKKISLMYEKEKRK